MDRPVLPDAVRRAVAHVRGHAAGPALDPSLRVTLNFHPERLEGVTHGRTVLARLADDGVYRSQFETRSSNGGLTAHPGGDRWRWESRIFGGAYDTAEDALRPRYGALDVHRRPNGAAPRFGSSHLRLAAPTLRRTTFCFPDSVFEPMLFGTADAFALADATASTSAAWGHDLLDDYVEAHVHGVVDVRRDVEALVLDPSFRGTRVEEDAAHLGVPLEWHVGYRLPVEVLRAHPDYRGPEVVALGERVAVAGLLTPRIVGEAAATGEHDPQTLKRVWHHVARFGLDGPGDRTP